MDGPKKMAEIVGDGNVSTKEGDIATHANSDWSSHRADPAHRPFCVVHPWFD